MSTTPVTPSILIDSIIEAVAVFLRPFVGTAEIVRGQGNRVSQPPDPCVVLTELLSVDLETPTVVTDAIEQQMSITNPGRIDIQADFYGIAAGDQVKAVKMVMRSGYAVERFPAGIAPLYCSDGIQAPFRTAEQQWGPRWILTLSLQYNPTVVIAQQSATALTLNKVTAVDL